MNCSIITIGDELLIGQTIDTNSAWIGKQLNELGILINRRVAVGDDKNAILKALQEEENNSDLIIITGGLGPTADDITKPLLCEYFNAVLVENEAVKEHVRQIFVKRNRPILEVNMAQAMLPNNCTVLWNQFGTAAGMWFEKNNKIFISLPGVPFEMKQILIDNGLAKIKKYFSTPNVIHRNVVTAGKGESFIAEMLIDFEKELPTNIKLAYLPKLGGVKLRLTGVDVLSDVINFQHEKLYVLVKSFAFAKEDTELENVIGEILIKNNATLATAESCTGGAIAALITSVSGASSYFKGSVISYVNEVKHNVLKVENTALQNNITVNEEATIQMAKNVLQMLQTSYAIAITGFLEEAKGFENQKGEVWIAVTNGEKTNTMKAFLPYNRLQNCELASNIALNFLRNFIESQQK